MIPRTNYTCGNITQKTSCEKKIIPKRKSPDSCKKDCCKKNHDSEKGQQDCNGKCGHSNCTTSSLQFSLINVNEFKFDHNSFNFSPEKSVSYYKTARISAGFTSIWSLPKIK